MRSMMLATMVLVGCAGAARAETLPLLEGVPTTYTPGQSFSFILRVPELPDFASYTVELIFGTELTNPPLTASATPTNPSAGYVFPSNAGFQQNFDTTSSDTEVILTISDSTSPPVQALPGVNDTLVQITVNPGTAMREAIIIALGASTTFDYGLEGPRYREPEPFIIVQGDIGSGPEPIPAPPSVLLLAIGGFLLAVRRRFARRAGSKRVLKAEPELQRGSAVE